MIELHISAGCAWSVWETRGGLQPTIEELKIPPEFGNPLKEWAFRKISGIHDPLFTGRREFDAEGRSLAMRLQEEVGSRFHVNFRNWIAFDSKRWRTRWKDEDLLTGRSKFCWIEEDLPGNLAIKVLRIFPDAAGTYLWDLNGCCIGNENPAFSDELDERLTTWSNRWDTCYDIKTMRIDKTRLAEERFDEQGVALAAELNRAVGADARVIYYCTLTKAALEILENGQTVKCPRETDFRQWALD